MQLMAQRGGYSSEHFSARLRQWLTDWDKGRAPEYERRSEEAFDQRVRLVVEIQRMLEPRQRAIALQRVQDYIDDFTRLAERREVRTAAQ
jgi:hypothetical protein